MLRLTDRERPPKKSVKLFQKTNKRTISALAGSLFRRLDRVDEIHVYGLIAHVGGHMRRHIPVQRWREQLVGGGQIFAQINRVVNLSKADLPGAAKFCHQAVVKPSEFEFAHVKNGAFGDIEPNGYGAGGVVKLRFRFDRGRDKSSGPVELLDVLDVVA